MALLAGHSFRASWRRPPHPRRRARPSQRRPWRLAAKAARPSERCSTTTWGGGTEGEVGRTPAIPPRAPRVAAPCGCPATP
eukprot:6207972-Pleurochrysis_carterae.AAC.1